jgi:hypothetical protein
MLHILISTNDFEMEILATLENAKEFVGSILNEERYDFSKVGRFKFNNRFGSANR